jgi:hypothetical protein
VKRVNRAKRNRLLSEAELLAQERAKLFRLQRRNRMGEALGGHRLHEVTGERKRRNLIEKGARPVLASSEWRAIYEEVGLL